MCAVRNRGTNPYIWAHMPETGRVADFKKAKVPAQAKSKGSRRIQNAWLSSPSAVNCSIQLYPSFLVLRHALQEEGNRRVPVPQEQHQLRQPHCERPDQPESPKTYKPCSRGGGVARSRACIITVRISGTQHTEEHSNLTTCFGQTVATCNVDPSNPHYRYSYLSIIRNFIE